MKLACVTGFLYSLVVLTAGGMAFVGPRPGGGISLVAAVVAAIALVGTAWVGWQGRAAGGYACGALTFLLAIYFAYRFLSTDRFIPSGVFLIISFLALFLILLGVFLSLRHELEQR